MRNTRRAVAGGLLASAFALPAGPSAASPESEMVRELNEVRGRYGQPPLRRSTPLGDTSRQFARRLMHSGSLAHDASFATAAGFRRAGETLSLHRGTRPHVRYTAQRWLESSTHRAVLLSGGFRWIGVGRSQGTFGGRLTTIWVARLGGL